MVEIGTFLNPDSSLAVAAFILINPYFRKEFKEYSCCWSNKKKARKEKLSIQLQVENSKTDALLSFGSKGDSRENQQHALQDLVYSAKVSHAVDICEKLDEYFNEIHKQGGKSTLKNENEIKKLKSFF